MHSSYNRKKQPELVRRAILDEAIRIAAAHGLAEVTIQAVATGAGVTKGGVFHHFASKQVLLGSLFEDMLQRLDAEIDAHMAGDPMARGSFTRAYVDVLTVGEQFGIGSPFDALGMATMSDPVVAVKWDGWIATRLARHRSTDDAPMLEIVRFAADGAWLSHLGEGRSRAQLSALRDRLIAMTHMDDA